MTVFEGAEIKLNVGSFSAKNSLKYAYLLFLYQLKSQLLPKPEILKSSFDDSALGRPKIGKLP